MDAGYPRGSNVSMEKLYPAMKNIWEAIPTARNRIDWDMSFRDSWISLDLGGEDDMVALNY